MKAYVFMRTKFGACKDVVEYLAESHEESFKKGVSLYGWYDAMAEFEISDTRELNKIVDDLKRNYLRINHIGTVVERNDAPNSLMDLKRVE